MTSCRARFLPAVIALVTLLAACSINVDIGTKDIEGSGDVETRTYSLTNFDQLDVSSAFVADVTVVPGGEYQVEVSADDNLFEELLIEVDGDTLEIGVRSEWRVRTEIPLIATVTMPALKALEASGAAHVTVAADGTDIDNIEASGASTVRVTDLDGTDISIDASGASTVELMGIRAEEVSIDASGASRVDLRDLPIENGNVDASGASVVEFGSAAEVDGNASGASSVRVEPSTDVDVDTSGGSSVDVS
ncbi:MAG: head GIN domain-containing protein [Acidimicrobiales bacterium]